MKRFILCFFASVTLQMGFAQKVYFIYFQTDQEQSFFVRMDEKIYSSTVSGYLILSKLYDTTYNFSIGFPKNKWPEQKFSVTMNKKDHGFLLKNFEERGWGLFDLQTLAVQMAATNESKNNNAVINAYVSPFTEILAKATDDSTLKQKPVVKKVVEKKTEIVLQPDEKKEVSKLPVTELPINKQEEKKNETMQQEVKMKEIKQLPADIYQKSIVTRKSESSTTTGFSMLFIDDYGNGEKDTIRILIPEFRPATKEIKQEQKDNKKFLDIIADTVKQDKEIILDNGEKSKPVQEKSLANQEVVKNNCKEIADESDFLKLRKDMAAVTTDDDMTDAAKKYFRTKCFTTIQIKNLSALFLNDAGKYKFFDAAYSFVSDAWNFSSLQSELKEEYYINRFKAMLRN